MFNEAILPHKHVCQTLGFSNLKIIGYKLYPNPSSETIFLDFGASISGQFAIYNLTGSLISEEQFMDRSVLVIDKPRNGVYILDLKTNETQVKYKLIFQD